MSGKEYKVIFYKTKRGGSPAHAYIESLEKKAQAKVYLLIGHLEQGGPRLRRPQADTVRGKIKELRIVHSSNQYRILYFFYIGDSIILLHGFTKKTQEIPEKEIEKAEHRMEDFMKRYESGERVL